MSATASVGRGRAPIGIWVFALLTLVAGVAEVPVARAAHDLSAGLAPTYALVLALVASGVIVARHQPRNPVGWLLLGSSLFFALNGLASDYSVLDYRLHHGSLPLGALAVLLQPSWAPGIACFALSIVMFPNGRLPGWAWRGTVWAFLALSLLWLGGAFSIAIDAIATGAIHVNPGGDLAAIDKPLGGNAWWGYAQDAFFAALMLCSLAWIGRQLGATRRTQGVERQQLKWFTSGGLLSLVGGIASVFGNTSGTGAKVLGAILGVGLAGFPISIAVAVTRYRLYEIDRVISRTIGYVILTGLLVATFIGVVALSTDVLPLSSRVGVAASTLAAAALFNPLRVRVQRLVDRRFNRTRYNAEATVAAFTTRLRDAVEIDAIRADLLDAVNRAVQPTHASIWIKQ